LICIVAVNEATTTNHHFATPAAGRELEWVGWRLCCGGVGAGS